MKYKLFNNNANKFWLILIQKPNYIKKFKILFKKNLKNKLINYENI